MNINVEAVRVELDEDRKKLLDKKLERIKYAEDLITDVLLKIKEDKKCIFDCTVNFRWGATAHVSAEDYDFTVALNKLMDILDLKVKKEKEKVQSHT